MTEIKEIAAQIRVEAVFQEALIEIVQNIQKDHGVIINRMSFEWIEEAGGSATVISCETDSKYRV